MEVNENLRAQIFDVLEKQLRANDPPETRATLERLRKQGFDELEAKQMIAQCLVVEIFDVIKLGKPYNHERYTSHLKALPEEPFDD